MKKQKSLFWILATITFLVLLTPHIIRFVSHDGLLPGGDAYYHMRMAEHIKENFNIPKEDPLVDRIYSYNPYHFILASSSYLFGFELASKIIPLILGMLSISFFYLVLKRLGLDEMRTFLVSLILVLSPIFIYTFSASSHFAIIIFLNLLGFYFFIRQEKIFIFLAIFTFATIPFFNFFNALVTWILLFTYTISMKINKKLFYFVTFGIVTRTIIYHLYIFQRFGLPQRPSFIPSFAIQNSVSDLGAIIGFSFFTILLAFVGLILTWKKRKELYYIYVLTILLIASSFYFGDFINIYLNFPLVILAGYGFFFLMDRQWEIKIIKNASLLIIMCGIIFSMTSYVTRFSTMEPDQAEVESLNWLKDNGDNSYRVLSHYQNGFWIEYFAKQPVMIDEYFDYINELEQKYIDSRSIFYSRSLKTTTALLDRNNIKYIWINKPMKEGLVWSKPDEGLLFLFSDSQTFTNIYSHNGIEIWEYIQ